MLKKISIAVVALSVLGLILGSSFNVSEDTHIIISATFLILLTISVFTVFYAFTKNKKEKRDPLVKTKKSEKNKKDKVYSFYGLIGLSIIVLLRIVDPNTRVILLGIVGALFLLFLFGMVGFFLAKKYLNWKKKNKKLMDILVWGNLLAWIIPVVGILVSVFFWEIKEVKKTNKVYVVLPAICFSISLFLSVYIALIRLFIS